MGTNQGRTEVSNKGYIPECNEDDAIKPEETPTYRWYKTQIEQSIDKIVILSEETKRELAEEEAQLRRELKSE